MLNIFSMFSFGQKKKKKKYEHDICVKVVLAVIYLLVISAQYWCFTNDETDQDDIYIFPQWMFYCSYRTLQ